VSLAIFGSETLHTYVRLLTAVEIIEHAPLYDTSSADFVVKDARIETSSFAVILDLVLHDGKYVEMVHLFAISAAVDSVIQSFVPQSVSVGLLDSPLTCLVVGRGVRTRAPQFTLMWSSMSMPARPAEAIDINHFALLALRPTTTDHVNLADGDDEPPLQDDDQTCDYDDTGFTRVQYILNTCYSYDQYSNI